MKKNMWDLCLRYLENVIDEHELATWFSPIKAVEEDGLLTLYTPNQFVMSKIKKDFLETIKEAISSSTEQESVKIRIAVGRPTDAKKNTKPLKPETSIDLVESSPFALVNSDIIPEYTFDSFIQGRSNQLSLAACQAAAEHPGKSYNPIFIYGNTGLGKTHLLHAFANAFLAEYPQKKIAYLKSPDFVRQVVMAIRHKTIDELKSYWQSFDAWLVDDIQFIQDKERTQQEFFETFNYFLEGKQQIILTCDQLPKNLSGLEERLRSRFSWGVTMEIEAPETELRASVLMDKAERHGIDLPDEVAFYIAEKMRTNLREIEGALNDILLHHRLLGGNISISMAKEVLNKRFSEQRVLSIGAIQKTVASYYRISIDDLKSKSRKRAISRPRQLCMALCKELTHNSLPAIGEAFGGRDHTTVVHAIKTINQLKQDDDDIKIAYTNLMTTFSSGNDWG